MDLEEIKNILDLIAESEVDQVTIEEGDFKIKVKKTADVVTGTSTPIQYQMPAGPPQAAQPAGNPQQPQQAAEEESAPSGEEEYAGNLVKSPIVGTFYRSPSPEDEPFVQLGDQIEKGETICIVEAMKIMNEIESEFSGEVKKILVEDGEAVEFEQPLFVVG
ncbi:MAG TPA: acetyl-CoA carboxylase biotin carboxyl carrier protein [Balneolaceae bacterium]|nr:acetyl-CoA carboxylase biotin carboxyl carrier protein [Balneolaceae bacterium]